LSQSSQFPAVERYRQAACVAGSDSRGNPAFEFLGVRRVEQPAIDVLTVGVNRQPGLFDGCDFQQDDFSGCVGAYLRGLSIGSNFSDVCLGRCRLVK